MKARIRATIFVVIIYYIIGLLIDKTQSVGLLLIVVGLTLMAIEGFEKLFIWTDRKFFGINPEDFDKKISLPWKKLSLPS